jgi:hypothetical protein
MSNARKFIFIIAGVAIVVGGGSFFGGMKYAESKNPFKMLRGDTAGFANLSQGDQQARFQQFGTNGAAQRGTRAGGGSGGAMIGGEIISKDDKSITVKIADGGSKIIFFSDTTQITKSAAGSSADLKVGENVSANGTTNSDGSITAQTIQLRSINNNPAQ